MIFPVTVGVLRMLAVLFTGILVTILSNYSVVISIFSSDIEIHSLGINTIFAGIVIGFTVVGFGLSSNMFTKNWNPRD